ncbi:MAG: hypothetical protein Q8S39_08505, partial [Ignavibacteria bacterium]|nr:hypothetical protein [Ignavibacteria bacterium]
MMRKILQYISVLAIFGFTNSLFAQIYPDQHYVLRIDSIKAKIETSENVKLSDDGKSFILQNNSIEGYIILKEQTALYPFNQGLPSYN